VPNRRSTLYIRGPAQQNIPLLEVSLAETYFFRLVSSTPQFCGLIAMADRIPMTRAGYNKIKAEMDELQDVKLPEAEKRIAAARAEGDLSENAEYHGARETHGMLMAKINLLKEKLAHAHIMDNTKLPKDRVTFGCTVVVKDLDFGDQEEFTLVGAGEEDYDSGRINVASPLAQGLVGKKVGEKTEVEVPAGVNRFEILEIRFQDE
jgi:transcription elongation factor GreA